MLVKLALNVVMCSKRLTDRIDVNLFTGYRSCGLSGDWTIRLLEGNCADCYVDWNLDAIVSVELKQQERESH